MILLEAAGRFTHKGYWYSKKMLK